MSPKKQSGGYMKQTVQQDQADEQTVQPPQADVQTVQPDQADEQTVQQDQADEQTVQQDQADEQTVQEEEDAEVVMLAQLLSMQMDISGSSNDTLGSIHTRVMKQMLHLTQLKDGIEGEQKKRAKMVKDELKKEEQRLEKLQKKRSLNEKKSGLISVKVLLPDKTTYITIKIRKGKTRGSLRRRAVKQAQFLGFFKNIDLKGKSKKKNPTVKSVSDVMLLDINNAIFTRNLKMARGCLYNSGAFLEMPILFILGDSDYVEGLTISFPDPSTADPIEAVEDDQDEDEESEDDTDDEDDD